jgi:hypothetical protein
MGLSRTSGMRAKTGSLLQRDPPTQLNPDPIGRQSVCIFLPYMRICA